MSRSHDLLVSACVAEESMDRHCNTVETGVVAGACFLLCWSTLTWGGIAMGVLMGRIRDRQGNGVLIA